MINRHVSNPACQPGRRAQGELRKERNYFIRTAILKMGKVKELTKDFHSRLREWDYFTLTVVITGALCLILNWYISPRWLNIALENSLVLDGFQSDMIHGVGFCLIHFFTLFFIPFLIMGALTRRARRTGSHFPARLRDTGLGWAAQSGFLWVFALSFMIIVPLLLWAATRESYQMVYPFFQFARYGPGFLLFWWFLYGLYYIGVEYFFRGFLIFGLHPKIGATAVLFSMMPYVMIHYTKPPSEAAGSIIAGILLGYMSLRSGSIWGGFLLHWLVGIAMDALSLYFGSGFME